MDIHRGNDKESGDETNIAYRYSLLRTATQEQVEQIKPGVRINRK